MSDCITHHICDCLKAQLDTVRSQLPPELPGRTIRFITCPVGHGRLMANNWIDPGCAHCLLDAVTQDRDQLRSSVIELLGTHGESCGVPEQCPARNNAQQALATRKETP